ncbi:uncharacterized protein [Panulirus ornatus]|uniref:uncharacterized protein n=1 Tax=Panulirus ornatus TaxID=150431 RepID=UPI003A836230
MTGTWKQNKELLRTLEQNPSKFLRCQHPFLQSADKEAMHQQQPEVRPSLTAPLQNLTVVAGRKAILTCVVENLGQYKVAWMHYGLTGRAVLTVGTVVITKNQRVSLLKEHGGASWSLVINNFTTSDQGPYLCQVNTAPLPEKLYFHISVVVPPRISRPPQDIVVDEGDDATLECEATGDPQPSLTWRREDGRPFSLNHTQVVEAAGPLLRLSSVSRGISGAFLCVASNGVPPAVSARVQVSVKFAPEMGVGTGVVWAEAGERALMVCGYRGWPEPTVTWTKDGAIIEGSLEAWEGRGTGSSKLVLNSVGPENFGHYRCIVANPLGTVSTTMTLVELTTTTTTTTTTTSTTTTTTTTPASSNKSQHYGDDGNQADGQVLWRTEGSLLSASSPASPWQPLVCVQCNIVQQTGGISTFPVSTTGYHLTLFILTENSVRCGQSRLWQYTAESLLSQRFSSLFKPTYNSEAVTACYLHGPGGLSRSTADSPTPHCDASITSPEPSHPCPTTASGADSTDAAPHRFVQDADPASDPRPRPLYPGESHLLCSWSIIPPNCTQSELSDQLTESDPVHWPLSLSSYPHFCLITPDPSLEAGGDPGPSPQL